VDCGLCLIEIFERFLEILFGLIGIAQRRERQKFKPRFIGAGFAGKFLIGFDGLVE